MSKLKLLFITKDHTRHIEKSSLYLTKELTKHCNLNLWSIDGDIQDIINHIGVTPDFILLNDYKPDYCPEISGMRSINIPFGIIMHDLQYKMYKRRQFIERENVRYIFANYREAFKKWYPEYVDRMIWFPHHVPTLIFKDYKLNRENDYLMMGAIYKELYPLRQVIKDRFQRDANFTYHSHPGYKELPQDVQGYKVGKDYALELNKAKIFFTCDSNYHFPILKYFETLACETLLLASGSNELRDLGFIDGKTFVEIDDTNFYEKAEYYLENVEERMKIVQLGAELIRNRHSTEIRVKELLDHIKRIINNRV
ncbi:glycosyltransferase [Pseudalkalibacillus hwajinpoensis]|uniref:glycosyltransferase n=1 Tax=Guptibacillus hwajinpoensis TaxID=208199 RepID=UPI00325BC5D7